MNDVHANKYKLLISSEIGSDYVMRYQLRLVSRQNSLSSNTSLVMRLHKRFLIEEFDHGSD